MVEQFIKDVDEGLSKEQKTLPSKYFYDKKGDALFVKIMHLPEYYLTRAEFEIIKEQGLQIIEAFSIDKQTEFELIELGAGDGKKTKELLRHLLREKYQFEYLPIDISKNTLEILEDSLVQEFPNLKVRAQQGDYFKVLDNLKQSKKPKIVLFLGSNIGNLQDEKAQRFLLKLDKNLSTGDQLFLGVDLIKDAEIIIPAYADSQGITAAFNLNLLERINRELDANFEISAFEHQVEYNKEEGIVKSYLKNKKHQEVYIGKINKSFTFVKGEKIHTEISRKYNDSLVLKICQKTLFKLKEKFTDSNSLFSNYILVK